MPAGPSESTTDPYEVLGLARTATLAEIKHRYRSLAARHHPDRGGEPWIFKQIRHAYEQICRERDAAQAETGTSLTRPRRPRTPQSTAPKPPPTPPTTPPPAPASEGSASSPFQIARGIGTGVAFIVMQFLTKYWSGARELIFVALMCILGIGFGVIKLGEALSEPRRPTSTGPAWLAFLSLALGLMGLASWLIPWLGWAVTIAGFWSGHACRHTENRELGLIGMALALFGFMLASGAYIYFDFARHVASATQAL
jgi:DnaJ domain